MSASYPKPDSQRRTRYAPRFDWADLPAAGRPGKPPALPTYRHWSKATVEAWAALWRRPQAVRWDQSGVSLRGWADLTEAVNRAAAEGGCAPVSVFAEIRAIEDRHGLSPKAMLQLRWRIADPEPPAEKKTTPAERRRLRVVHED